MVKINDYLDKIGVEGEWLKPEVIGDQQSVIGVIMPDARLEQYNYSDGSTDERLVLVVSIKRKNYFWKTPKKFVRLVSHPNVLGVDTDAWVGRRVLFSVDGSGDYSFVNGQLLPEEEEVN